MAVSRSTAWLGLLLSFLINAHFGFTTNFALRYSHFLTAFMAFGIGSLTCHYRQSLRAIALSGISVLAWCMHGLIWLWYDAWPWTYGLYVSVLLSAWVVVSLAEEKAGALDKWLGDLSYPLYLVHTTAAAWVLLFYKTDRTNFLFFIVSFAVTLLLSWFIVVVIDKPLDRLKYRPRT
jgi:peptidoglycan/LPS O-acetylase OafA/YrhL